MERVHKTREADEKSGEKCTQCFPKQKEEARPYIFQPGNLCGRRAGAAGKRSFPLVRWPFGQGRRGLACSLGLGFGHQGRKKKRSNSQLLTSSIYIARKEIGSGKKARKFLFSPLPFAKLKSIPPRGGRGRRRKASRNSAGTAKQSSSFFWCHLYTHTRRGSPALFSSRQSCHFANTRFSLLKIFLF